MKRNILHFVLSIVFYYALANYAKLFFVMPSSQNISILPFLPPLLGLMWGPVAAFGVAMGDFLTNLPNLDIRGMATVFFAAYLPYKLWYLLLFDRQKPVFAFNRTTLKKFLLITVLVTLVASVLLGLTRSEDELAELFAGANLMPDSSLEFAGMIFLHDMNIMLFFGMPIFFILISYRYVFYLPPEAEIALSDNTYEMNRLAVVLLYGFFLGLFVVLDVSGLLYDLDQMDTWLEFNGEILTTMNISLIALFYMLMKYRHSIMTNLMLMELAIIFVVTCMLGSISFVALSRAINDHVSNDLEKMSVIYRERLARTFNDTIMAVNSMSQLAANDLESRERFVGDAVYRANYLATMERNFSAIAENSPGSIGFYMQFPEESGHTGFLCTRNPKNWGSNLPDFAPHVGLDRNRYHLPEEKYLAKLSEPYMDETTGRYVVSYVAPLHKNDKFIGIVGIDIDFGYIIHEIKRMSVYEHGFVCLLDKNGDILYANQPNSEAFLNQRGLYQTESYLSTGIWLKIAALAHDIYADRNNMLIHFVVVMLFIVVVVSFFSVWLAQKGIRPLMLITEAARKIAAGDLNVKLPQDSKNELGILVDSIREMVSKLEIYVYRDKLTGLRNAAAYMKKTAEFDQRRQMAGEAEKLQYGIMVFDVNFLKKTNDTYGHEAGNELLRRASRIICKVFDHSPVFRIGGDEFTAILERHDYEHREELIAAFDEQIRAESFEVDGATLPVSVARGVGIYRPGMKYAEVFQEADDAMYEHKTSLKAQRE